MVNKIIFVVFSMRGGGAERVISQLSNELTYKQVEIVQLCDLDPFYKISNKVMLHKYYGPKNGVFRFLFLSIYLYKIFRRSKPDVVVSFGETISPFILLVAKLARMKVVVSNRASPLSSMTGRRSLLNPLAYRFADAVLVQTDRAVDILSKKFKKCRWIVLENPIPLPNDVPAIVDRANVCITVGYLCSHKGQENIITAFASIKKRGWELWIVGDGPDRQKLENLAYDLGVHKEVIFFGAVKDVQSLLLKAKVFAFASKSEGFPNALAEAMACGCACVSYDCVTGPAELIEHRESGLLINMGDFEKYCYSLGELFNSQEMCDLLSKKARQRVELLKPDYIADVFINEISNLP